MNIRNIKVRKRYLLLVAVIALFSAFKAADDYFEISKNLEILRHLIHAQPDFLKDPVIAKNNLGKYTIFWENV